MNKQMNGLMTKKTILSNNHKHTVNVFFTDCVYRVFKLAALLK